jgi:formylmethanofuran dehydrogenase subunit E
VSTFVLPEALHPCVAFHGHLCPGLVIGYRAATWALELLGAPRAGDEELVAIVENDTCAVDAVQTITGCTFGKGNLFFLDHGKLVFTLASRDDRQAVRLCLAQGTPHDIDEVPEEQRRERHIAYLLDAATETLFSVERKPLETLPGRAEIQDSHACALCGERVMATRLVQSEHGQICIPCHRRLFKEWRPQ